jgi:hypothetical protein
VRSAINELDPQPVVPRDEMWQRIDAARRFRRGRPPLRSRWIWGVGLAASLAFGIALGRITLRNGPQSGTARPSGAASAPAAPANAPALNQYRLAALQHLGRAEVLLTSVSSGSVDAQIVEWANEMLTTTRLLLDSPAATDARLSRLLEDLELLLAQLASPAATSEAELDLIQHGIDQTDVLPRLRATLPAPNAAGT